MPERNPESGDLLRELRGSLEAFEAPGPPDALVERTLLRAAEELGRAQPAPAEAARLAAGYSAELVRLLGAVLPALLLAAAWNGAVLLLGWSLLSAWLPHAVAETLLTAYCVGAAGWLALALGSVPLAAQRRALGRSRETAA